MCRLCWEDNMAMRTSNAVAEVVEVIGDVAAVDAVVIESAVIRLWGKRMSEGKGSQTYKPKKARSKESTPILTVEAKLAILEETRLPHVSQKDVLEKHGVSRSTCQSWRQREKAWRDQIAKDPAVAGKKKLVSEDPLLRIRQALHQFILRSLKIPNTGGVLSSRARAVCDKFL